MHPENAPVAEELEAIGDEAGVATVELSNELVPLLSEQLYRSPIKAIEELVVNSYDAGAKRCALFVPTPDQIAATPAAKFVAIYDDGTGMDAQGMVSLWTVGKSPKTATRLAMARKQIG